MVYFKDRNDLVQKYKHDDYDCIFIDNKWKVINRDSVLDLCMPISSKIVVLDNYSHKDMFPRTKGDFSLKGYEAEVYDSKFWVGSGTKILVKS